MSGKRPAAAQAPPSCPRPRRPPPHHDGLPRSRRRHRLMEVAMAGTHFTSSSAAEPKGNASPPSSSASHHHLAAARHRLVPPPRVADCAPLRPTARHEARARRDSRHALGSPAACAGSHTRDRAVRCRAPGAGAGAAEAHSRASGRHRGHFEQTQRGVRPHTVWRRPGLAPPAAGPATTSPAAIRLCAEVLVLKKLAVAIAIAGAADPLGVLG